MHKNLNRYKEEKNFFFKQRWQDNIDLISEGNSPTHTATLLLSDTVIRHLDNCSWPLSSKTVFQYEGKMLTMRRPCWVMNKWAVWVMNKWAVVLQGHSAQQNHLGFPSRVQPCCFPALRPFLSHGLHPSLHSFFSSHVFLKEPNPVLVETSCYYYLQEKQKILILSEPRVNNG